jgi:hypothetical protein
MSFILRKVFKDHTQSNIVLGDSYLFIDREMNYEEFSKAFEVDFGKFHVGDLDPTSDSFTKNCYAFLIINDGAKYIPLYKNQYNFIMTDSGKTFANITFK